MGLPDIIRDDSGGGVSQETEDIRRQHPLPSMGLPDIIRDDVIREAATQIINDIFWIKYSPTIDSNKSWYENLNKFLVSEWNHLQDSENTESQFTEQEEEQIVSDAFDILLEKLNVDEDDFEINEQEVDWMRFDDIIGHYSCIV